MDKGPRVKGASILGFWKFVKNQPNGDNLMAKVKADLPPAAAEASQKKIIAVANFPYQVFVDVIRTIDKVVGKGDLALCRKLGEYSAGRDLEALLQLSKEKPKPEQFLSAMELVWKNYHLDSGTVKLVDFKPQLTIVRIEGFPAMDPAHCRLMEGYFTQSLRAFGIDWIEPPREVKCMSKGADCHEFQGKWKAGGLIYKSPSQDNSLFP